MRSYAREVAFCKVFQYIMSGSYENNYEQFDNDKLDENDLQFADNLVNAVINNKSKIDGIIAELSKSFKLDRIYRPDLAVLELAIAEMQTCNTPQPVVINEAVGIAKRYSTEKSVSYVNGILAAYVKQ